MIYAFNFDGNFAIIIVVFVVFMTLIGLFTGLPARSLYKKIALNRKLKKITQYIIVNPDLNRLADYILVSKYGVFIIKVIQTQGYFYGSDKQVNWNLINKKKERTIKNPVRMVNEGCQILKDKFDVKAFGRLIFNFGNIEGVRSASVVKVEDLIDDLMKNEMYTDEEVLNIYNKLKDLEIKKLEK